MKDSVLKDFAKYVSLNILGQMAYSFYTLTDTFFVSAKLGTNGLTALNLAFPIFCIINGTGLMLGMGGGTKYSIYRSSERELKANNTFTNAIYLLIIFSLIYLTAGLFFSDSLVRFLGSDNTVFEMTKTYLQTMLLFAPAFLTNNLLQCFIRNDGSPSLSTKAMITGSISNIVLDYIFIFPLDMGIFGAILATGLSPIISICVLVPYLIRKKNNFHYVKAKISIKSIEEITASGISPFLTETTSGIVMFLFNFIILKLSGNIGVAAFGIICVISLVVVAIYTGLAQGIQPIISNNYGARKQRNIDLILTYAMVTMFFISIVIYSIIYFNADSLTALFNSENDISLQTLAIKGLKLYFIACPFIGFNIVLSTFFISSEKPILAQIISLSRGLFILIPMAFLLSSLFNMSGVWLSYPATEIITSIIATILYLSKRERKPTKNRLM